jgi:hypothetical protein
MLKMNISMMMMIPIVKILFLVGSSKIRDFHRGVVPLGLDCGRRKASRPLWHRSFRGMQGAYIGCLMIAISLTVVAADIIRIHVPRV